MIEDQSFGIVPLIKQEKGWKVFLILHREGNHWGFPKGHKHGEETPLEAAIRELREETGLNFESLVHESPLTEEYQFRRKGEIITKRVVYFPALVSGDYKLQSEEIRDGAWFSFLEALQRLTFKEGRSICTELMKLLT
jgi:bis(5'-nucleosidyl)-tetraphosphatase